jgi:hypothetical protein
VGPKARKGVRDEDLRAEGRGQGESYSRARGLGGGAGEREKQRLTGKDKRGNMGAAWSQVVQGRARGPGPGMGQMGLE